MSHTLGPWEIDHSYQWPGKVRSAANGRFIADASAASGTVEENLANAALIAAAPDLLEALQGLLKIVRANIKTPEMFDEFYAAQAAIEKATSHE